MRQRAALAAGGTTLLLSAQKHTEGQMERLLAPDSLGHYNCSCMQERDRDFVRPVWSPSGSTGISNGEQVFVLLSLVLLNEFGLKSKEGDKTKNMGCRERSSLL